MNEMLKIDPELASLGVPKNRSDMGKLKRNLTQCGCKEPITVWNETIVDGHKRYQLCREKGVDYEISQIDFDYQEEAVAWVCRQRLTGELCTHAMQKYLIGRLLRAEQKLTRIARANAMKGRSKKAFKVSSGDGKKVYEHLTSFGLSCELGLHRTTIDAYSKFSRMLDRINECEPRFFLAILMGEIVLTGPMLKEISKKSNEDIKLTYENWLYKGRRKTVQAVKSQFTKKERHPKEGKKQDMIYETEIEPIVTGIKEMPAFDPDMDLNGLSLTIPMWTNAIRRARDKMNIRIASIKARRQLTNSLVLIEKQIQESLEDLNDE